jgi:hypothetical protein
VAFLAAFISSKPAQAQLPIRVNCGGPAYTDSKGQVWAADYGFTGGRAYQSGHTISATPDSTLFNSERVVVDGGTKIIYSFAVPNGSYHINLNLAEIYYTQAGARVMNAKLQGSAWLSNLDIFAAVGANAALTKSSDFIVSTGAVTLELDNVVDHAKCSSIEILPVTSAPSGPLLTLNFTYPDGTPVAGTLAYTITSSLLSFQGTAPLNNGQAQCVIYSNPSALGLSAQFQVNLSLTDTAGHTLWQFTIGMNPAQVNLGTVQSSALNVVVQKL